MEVKASLKFARIGAQKARLVADVIRGKNINEAVRTLTFMQKKSAPIFKKLIESAMANAEEKQVIDIDTLYVKKVVVDQGPVLKRFKPSAQGRARPIRKKMSHILVVLSEKGAELKKEVSKKTKSVKETKKGSPQKAQAKEKTVKKVVANKTTTSSASKATKTASTKKGDHGSKS